MNGAYIENRIRVAEESFGNYWDYAASNVVLTNGDYDPWSALGANASYSERHQLAIRTTGAAHCAEMYPAYSGEPEHLAETRETVKDQVRFYIADSTPPPPPIPDGGSTRKGNFYS